MLYDPYDIIHQPYISNFSFICVVKNSEQCRRRSTGIPYSDSNGTLFTWWVTINENFLSLLRCNVWTT